MARKILLALLLGVVLMAPKHATAQFYIGGGVDYMVPTGKWEEYNDNSLGFNVFIESRHWCKAWFGMRFDYISLEKQPDLLVNEYDKAFLFSPQIRYCFFSMDYVPDKAGNLRGDYVGKFMPYLQGMLTVSSINGIDPTQSKLGLGGGVGGGAALGFKLFGVCWMLDLNVLFSAPNAFLRDEARPNLQSINAALSLSFAL